MATWYINAQEVDNDETVFYTLEWHLDVLRSDGDPHRVLYPGFPMRGTGDFYCLEHGFHGKRGDDFHACGRACAEYEPRNGKNGRCRHSRDVYDYDAKKPMLLKPDGSLTPLDPKGITTQMYLTPTLNVGKVIAEVDANPRSIVDMLEDLHSQHCQ